MTDESHPMSHGLRYPDGILFQIRLTMPITPFHLGPGLLFSGLSRHISLSAFIIANCLIDLEPTLAYLMTGDPVHRFMHTYFGANFAALLTAQFARRPVEQWLRYWNSRLSPAQANWMGCQEAIPVSTFWIGAFVGAWSHVWIDAFMHADVEPWWPFQPGNLVQGAIDISELHALCLIAGLIGLPLLAWKYWVTKSPSHLHIRKWTKRLLLGAAMLLFGIFSHQLRSDVKGLARVCAQITPGMTVAQVKELSDRHSLTVYGGPDSTPGLTHLKDRNSFSSSYCDVSFENGFVSNALFTASE